MIKQFNWIIGITLNGVINIRLESEGFKNLAYFMKWTGSSPYHDKEVKKKIQTLKYRFQDEYVN